MKERYFEPEQFVWSSDFNPARWFPTGAVLGIEQLFCSKGSPARTFDDWQLEASSFTKGGLQISEQTQLYGFRRPLWIRPSELSWVWEEEDLILEFSLPTGSYASVFLASLLTEIDPQGCVSNGLIIPIVSRTLFS